MTSIAKSTKVSYEPSISLRPVQITYINNQHKEFVKFCNNLRCPLCNGQLDGNIHAKLARLYCVNDNSEYKTTWSPNKIEPDFELIIYTHAQYQYIIEYGTDWLNNKQTIINRYNMDAHPSHRHKTKKEVFKYSGRLLIFRKRMEEEIFLEKLKTYNLFS